jgi:hypothetical protein
MRVSRTFIPKFTASDERSAGHILSEMHTYIASLLECPVTLAATEAPLRDAGASAALPGGRIGAEARAGRWRRIGEVHGMP